MTKTATKKRMKRRKTIKRSELCRLAFCNSKKLPSIVEIDGRRKWWTGIGWVDEGKATGTEVKMVED